jgi:RNA polymerase sigma-70 factor (ECF subfamily)
MENVLKQAKITEWQSWVEDLSTAADYAQVYEASRHRIYALAYWMTRDEMQAERISAKVFQRAFTASCKLDDELLDKILVSEVRELMPLGVLSLPQPLPGAGSSLRRNVKKVQLEEALWRLPATERMIFLLHDVEAYTHPRVARTVSISEVESQLGLHAARLRLRELLASMQ